MLMTGSLQMDAERAFTRMARSRRRAALACSLRRRRCSARLRVVAESARRAAVPGPRRREIPIEQIAGTLEPSRARQFDAAFRPSPDARSRWERVWLAEQRGQVLPPISVVPVEGGYAVRDGHHRISVARARGAVTIDATVETALA